MFRMLGSCWGQTVWWRLMAVSPTFCRHELAAQNENFENQLLDLPHGEWKLSINFEFRPSSYLITSQRIWSAFPVVYLLNSNDDFISQWESCSKFKVLSRVPISTMSASGSLGSALQFHTLAFVVMFWYTYWSELLVEFPYLYLQHRASWHWSELN